MRTTLLAVAILGYAVQAGAVTTVPAPPNLAGAYYSYSYSQGHLTTLTPDQVGLGTPGPDYVNPLQQVLGTNVSTQSWNSVGVADATVAQLTHNGAYSFSYNESSNVGANGDLHSYVSTVTNDLSHASGTTMYGNTASIWGDTWLVAGPSNTKGYLGVKLKLEGGVSTDGVSTSTVPFNNYASLSVLEQDANWNINAIRGIYLDGASSWSFASLGASQPPYFMDWTMDRTQMGAWTGSATSYVMIPFVTNVPFNVTLILNLLGSGNSTLDFSHTGLIDSIDTPLGVTLYSGEMSQPDMPIYSVGANGNLQLSPVPEPAVYAMLLSGLLLLAARRRRSR